MGGYRIPQDKDARNILTRSKQEEFSITEMEVWEIHYID
jgi:hypothetical protein